MKMDFCPHAVMTWRNHRAVCGYARTAHDPNVMAILCSSPHRVLRTRLDAVVQAETYAAMTAALSGVPSSWKTARSAAQDGHRNTGASSNNR
jgi:hypothetical protein